MSNISEQEFVDLTKNKFGPTTGSSGSGNVNFGPVGGGNNKFGPVTGGQKFGPTTGNSGGQKFGPTTGTGGTTADPFACLLKDADLKLSADKKTVTYVSQAGSTWTFYQDKKFNYKYKSGKEVSGTWDCNGTDHYTMSLSDGDSYDSKTKKWASSSSSSSGTGGSGGSGGSASTFTNTSLTIDDVKVGKEVSKGMKGAVVGEIQKLLIAAGFKNISKSGNVDNIFGSRTKSSVEDFQKANKDADGNQLTADGIVGDKTINALLKATPASSSSSSSEDPNRKPFDPNAEEDNSIPSTDGALIKEKKKMLQESLKKMLRNSLLKYS